MYCRESAWHNFRNLESQRLEWAEGLNLLTGENASGKTNLLEVLHMLTGWGAFRSLRKSVLVNWNSEEKRASLWGSFAGEDSFEVLARLGGRSVLRCDGKMTNCTSVRYRVPALAFLPGDLSIIDGSPAVRRRFLDRLSALLFPLYATRLSEYRRALRHRKVLLQQRRNASITARVMAPLVSWLWSKRVASLDLVRIGLGRVRSLLPESMEISHMRGGADNCEDLMEDFWESLRKMGDREIRMRTPLVGPHRDDIDIRVGDRPAAQVFSRGQRRRAALAMIMAAAWAVERKLRRKPILLLDEISSELDGKGRDILVQTIEDASWQVFAATAEDNVLSWPGAIWMVDKGRISRSE